MPELPEVETIVREMRQAGLLGLKIERAIILWERSIANLSSSDFCQQIANQTIHDISRRGKFIVLSLTNHTVLVHLRMTGKFLIDTEGALPSSHERIRLYLSDGRILRYEDQRKFGKWYLTEDPQKILEKIGIEPLSINFTLNAFKGVLKGKKKQIKPFLLDQQFVAGIGNIYVDEALWMAKIHPLRSVESLTAKEVQSLHKAIIFVLKKGVDNIGTSLGTSRANYYSVSGRRGSNQESLNVFRCDGLPCARCHTIIEKIVVGQRGTHFCPKCQLCRVYK
ncbi:MAG: DNA-formamidopyrimidine glycosylase [Parachlamydiaceae bacterium]|nr:DNA-formamidopyrimidine glycosylase [Parachlamydiaceae bacterium]